MVTIHHEQDLTFRCEPPTGNTFVLDAHPESGGHNKGPTPVEALLGAVGSCSAMDVIEILRKKRQVVTSYRLEVSGVRGPEGQYPRPFQSITVRHILKGDNLDPAAVARAIELTDLKYCTVIATLRAAPTVESVWEIEA